MLKVGCLMIGLFFICGCISHQSLTVTLIAPQSYVSGDGSRFIAQYGGLSDDSLSFVKLTMPDGNEFTLPQVVAGSGAKYSDGFRLVWWEHQGVVLVEVMTEDGKWQKKYQDVRLCPNSDAGRLK